MIVISPNCTTKDEKTAPEDQKIFKILFDLSKFLGLSIPNLFNYNGVAVCFIIYSLAVCLALLGFSVLVIYSKLQTYYMYLIKTVVILDATIDIGAATTNILSIVIVVISSRRNIVNIIRNLKRIETSLFNKFPLNNDNEIINHQQINVLLVTQLLILKLIIFAYVLFCGIFIVINEPSFLRILSLLIVYVNILMISITVMQIHYYSVNVRRLIQILNKYLITVRPESLDVTYFLKTYDKVCDIIDAISNSYGIQIMTLSCIIILVLIKSLNLMMKVVLQVETLSSSTKAFVLISDTWNSIIFIVST